MITGISHAQRTMMGLRAERAGVASSPADLLKRLGLDKRAAGILNVWGVTMADVVGRRRFNAVARARHHLWALLYYAGQSYPAIARVWRCDHTSIMHGVGAHTGRYGVPK